MLKNILIIKLFCASALLFGMEVQDQLVKIQTNDDEEFEISSKVAEKSLTLKNLIIDLEDNGEDQTLVPLQVISGPLFTTLLSAMNQLAFLPGVDNEEQKEQQLKNILLNLKYNNQQLNNVELINLIAGINYLEICELIDPAMRELSQRNLSIEDWRSLDLLGGMLEYLWEIHPAKKCFDKLFHKAFDNLLQSSDGKLLISWSKEDGSIKVWDIDEGGCSEKKTLYHKKVSDVKESIDNLLICWSEEGAIKVWDRNNLEKDPIALNNHNIGSNGTHLVSSMGKYLISAYCILYPGVADLKIWDMQNFANKPIMLEGVSYFLKTKRYLILSFTKDNLIKVFDINDLSKELIVLDHFLVKNIIESSDGQYLLSCSGIEIKIWNMDDFAASPKILRFVPGLYPGLMESSDGRYIIAWAGVQGQDIINVWDKNNLDQEPLSFDHPNVNSVVEIADGKFVSSDSNQSRIWDVMQPQEDPIILDEMQIKDVVEVDGSKYLIFIFQNNLSDYLFCSDRLIKVLKGDALADEPIDLGFLNVEHILVTSDKKSLITFSAKEKSIKIWKLDDLQSKPKILKHQGINGVLEHSNSGNIISWSRFDDIKMWGIKRTASQIFLLLAGFFVDKGGQSFKLTLDEQRELRLVLNGLSPTIQKILKEKAPELIAELEEEVIELD